MAERRCPTTAKVQSMIGAGGGANVKSGTKVCIAGSKGSNSVTFTTAFASTPQVVLTVQDANLVPGDDLLVVRSVSTTGFDFDAEAACTVAWIATDAGNS